MSAKKKPMKRTTMGHRSEASQGAELSAAEEEEAILDRERQRIKAQIEREA